MNSFLAVLACVFSGVAQEVRHTFTFVPPKPVHQVTIAGTFNGWDKNATPLRLSGGAWSISLPLRPGKYRYKFVVDDQWITDPKAQANEGDGNGNVNSVLVIVPGDYDRPASPNDGVVAASALEHATEIPYFNFDRGHLTLSLRTRPNDVADVKVVVKGVGSFPMQGTDIDDLYRRYTVSIPWDRKRDLSYHFELRDGRKTFPFGKNGLNDSADYRVEAKKFKPFEVPPWVEKGVIYQIFPDRFANGDTKNDPRNVQPWNATPTYSNRFGGDIAGIRQHLDYLEGLGVKTLYLNPIFLAGSNHRYDTIDYLKVDPEIGTNEEFGQLTRELKSRGIRTVLDGVFNHTSTKFFAFDDVVRNGAASKYTGWYGFKSFPVKIQENPNYVAWFNFPSMPKVNHSNPAFRRYLLDVPVYWAKHADVAGWRLDVANEVPMDFWRDFRRTVKSINPQNWILGEEWGDATRWLQGDQWDSVMDYPFRGAVLNFVGKDGSGKPSDLMNGLMAAYSRYAPQVSRNAMNLIGSHDTPRILTMCGEDKDLAKLAASIQFTWAGTPSIYYGDELGMSGGKDPENRRGMEWAKATDRNEFLTHYRRLIAIRNANPALQSGDPVPLGSNDANGTATYARVLDADKGQIAVIALNRSDRPQQIVFSLDRLIHRRLKLVDALGGEAATLSPQGQIRLSLAPKSAAILVPPSGLIRHSRLGRGSRRPASV
ncbi:alpha amylase N-terminal ig-like domain-containing protein [Fimbriimonas ginsengisoli]|uniref:Alpha amylase catalytic region n=1 Tax=Fimbriimonas ginsengisoli Gsoil 348 TaxID=661478 RepID=A0A068NQI1_FIMGI|nr:alpha amylase N-terminal ig-like domain-containing protein [Fimbriimonas ginsengisoli]AIE85612.1 alpha amylase catalytic region [Fimbriimonas ginsengisoli Gsoil 348]